MWLAVVVTFVREGVTCWKGMLAADNALIVTLGIPHGTSARSETILELATQVLLPQLCTPLVSHCIGTYSLGKREEKPTHESLPISPQKHGHHCMRVWPSVANLARPLKESLL